MTNGGMVSMATFMPRYVEPQTTYSTIEPTQIGEGAGLGTHGGDRAPAGVMAAV